MNTSDDALTGREGPAERRRRSAMRRLERDLRYYARLSDRARHGWLYADQLARAVETALADLGHFHRTPDKRLWFIEHSTRRVWDADRIDFHDWVVGLVRPALRVWLWKGLVTVWGKGGWSAYLSRDWCPCPPEAGNLPGPEAHLARASVVGEGDEPRWSR